MITLSQFQMFWRDSRDHAGMKKIMKNPVTDHEQKADHKGISWTGEERACFAHAAQVGQGDQGYQRKTKKHLMVIEPGPAGSLSRGGDGSNARGNRNRNGKYIIN